MTSEREREIREYAQMKYAGNIPTELLKEIDACLYCLLATSTKQLQVAREALDHALTWGSSATLRLYLQLKLAEIDNLNNSKGDSHV